ncbi:class I SAM-dependent methyltransferase [Sphingomonas sp. PAMC 26605]|uniref:class I SAM-dependent methyltransferase n=1 Tax=Sphingomonas sp. PAMC 26605 TaxID=1112214 RepID=UPI00026CB1E1|nr:class I SAM-dependent methyltransferase [Sphingomonas sp. PAMC 26605]
MHGALSLLDLGGNSIDIRAGRSPANHDLLTLPMMDIYISMMKASALATAGRLRLFEALAVEPLEVTAIATTIGADRDGVERLADFLVATHYLVRDGAKLANAPETTRWFTSCGSVDYSSGLAWTANAWAIMDDLSGAVRRGGPERLLWDRMTAEPELGRSFALYMLAFAKHVAPDLLRVPNLPVRPKRMLDLGGSHGIHSMAFCDRFPELRSVIIDLESAVVGTAQRLKGTGLADRVEVRPGDIRTNKWGDDYDIALYLCVAHNMSITENREIFQRLAQAMRPGGILIIHDYPRETTPSLFETAFRLTLLVETGTRTYTFDELSQMVTEAGFFAPTQIVLSPAEKGTLLVAQR